jgi:hypothetical protein
VSSSRVPASVDALVAALKAGVSFPVYDGPELSSEYTDAVFIGFDGDPLGERKSAAASADWAGIGAKRRNEIIDILCAAVAVSGDGIPKDARDRSYAVLGAVETVLRADPSLAQTPTPFVASITAHELLWDWLETAGLQARLTFTVHIETRI